MMHVTKTMVEKGTPGNLAGLAPVKHVDGKGIFNTQAMTGLPGGGGGYENKGEVNSYGGVIKSSMGCRE